MMTLQSACIRATSSTIVRTMCPPLVSYSKTIQKKAAVELDSLPKDSALRILVNDYIKLRDACRRVSSDLSSLPVQRLKD